MSGTQKVVQLHTREASFELLRILAMLMIIGLHYLNKGAVLPDLERRGIGAAGICAWVFEAAFLVAVNVYVLISGYFGCDKPGFQLSKVLRLWGMALFYSIIITAICLCTGQITFSEMSIYDWINVVFPVITEEYWFVTAYILLLIFMPFLNAGIRKLDQKSFCRILILLLFIYSVAKTVLPIMQLPMEDAGYSVLWFICLYLVGAYLKKYGQKLMKHTAVCLICYLGGIAVIFASIFILRELHLRTGGFTDYLSYCCAYNNLFCLIGAVGLFGLFTHVKLQPGKAADVICRISGCTLGVYLIHEQIYIRYLWPTWFRTSWYCERWGFVTHMAGSILLLFSVCAVLESLRRAAASKIAQHIQRSCHKR